MEQMTRAGVEPTTLPPLHDGRRGSPGIRVMAVAVHPIARQGLQSMLQDHARLQWAGCAASGAAALHMASAVNPDVVVLDVDLPDMDAVQAMGMLKRVVPQTRFVLMAEWPDALLVRRASVVSPCSVLLKSVDQMSLTAAIADAHGGRHAHAPEIQQQLAPRPDTPGADLTHRERELLALLVRGQSNRDIASQLGIAMPTVKYHMTKIMLKLDAANRTAVVLIALRHQLVIAA